MRIIALQGAAKKGKTSAIRRAYEIFKAQGIVEFFQFRENGDDIEAIIKLPDGRKVGFFSQGDYSEDILHNIDTAKNGNCDILATAVRTKGGTVDIISNYCYQNSDNEVLLLGVIDMYTDSNPSSSIYDNINGNNCAAISSLSATHLLNVIQYVLS